MKYRGRHLWRGASSACRIQKLQLLVIWGLRVVQAQLSKQVCQRGKSEGPVCQEAVQKQLLVIVLLFCSHP